MRKEEGNSPEAGATQQGRRRQDQGLLSNMFIIAKDDRREFARGREGFTAIRGFFCNFLCPGAVQDRESLSSIPSSVYRFEFQFVAVRRFRITGKAVYASYVRSCRSITDFAAEKAPCSRVCLASAGSC